MNNGSMQGMMAPRGGVGAQQQFQNGPQRPAAGMPQLHREVLQKLEQQQQQLAPGWKATLHPHGRASWIFQLATSLQLCKPMSSPHAIQTAMKAERQTLEESLDKAAYDAKCRGKLAAIRTAREVNGKGVELQFAQNMQMNMGAHQVPGQNGMGSLGPNQFQQNFPNPQLQRAMQPSALPMQQQPPLDFNQQLLLQQQQQQQQQEQRAMSNNVGVPRSQAQQLQQLQNVPQNVPRPMMNQHVRPQLTPEEAQQIQFHARQMRMSCSQQDMENITQKLSPAQRQQLKLQNVDPLLWYFRHMATKNLIMQKQKGGMLQQQPQPGANAGMVGMPQQPLSMPQSSGPLQFGAVSMAQFDPIFGGNIHQFGNQVHGLQQEALRSQEEGQVVVPASGSQKPLQQQQPQPVAMQAMPQQQPLSQPNSNQTLLNHSQFALQQDNAQQAARLQAQVRPQNAGAMKNQLSQQSHLQGQAGGLNNPVGQTIPQHSPAMPNLNRPLGPSVHMGQHQGPPQSRQQIQPSQVQANDMGLSNQRSQQQQQQPSGQINTLEAGPLGAAQMQGLQMKFPPHMKQKFDSLPPEEQKRFMMRLAHSRTGGSNPGMRMQVNGAGGVSVQDYRMGQAQPSQFNQRLPGQAPGLGVQNFNTFTQSPSQLTGASGVPTPSQPMPGAGFELQFQSQKQQPMQSSRSSPAVNLTDEQVRHMDQLPWPPAFLIQQLRKSLPANGVHNWGDLKAWAAANPHIAPPEILAKLRQLQVLHFVTLSKQDQMKKQQAMNAQSSLSAGQTQQPGPAPPAQMVQPRNNLPQGPSSIAQTPLNPQNMPNLRPSVEEIQSVRMQHPDAHNFSDNELSSQIMRRKMEHYFTTQNRNAQQLNITPQQIQYDNVSRAQPQQFQRQNFMPNSHIVHGQLPQSVAQGLPTLSHTPKAVRPSKGQGAMQEPGRAPQPRATVRPTTQSEQAQKGLKRGNEDEVIEVPNPKLAHQRKIEPPKKQMPSQQKSAPSQAVQGTSSSMMQQQKQQQQSSQYELELRNQAAQTTTSNSVQQSTDQTTRGNQERQARIDRLKQITQEITSKHSQRKQVHMDQRTRDSIRQILKDKKEMVCLRGASLEQHLFMTNRDEEQVKDLIRKRLPILAQFHKGEPIENLTIGPDELRTALQSLEGSYRRVVQSLKAQQNAAGNQPTVQNAVNNSNSSPSQALSTNKREPEAQPRQAPRHTAMQRNHSNRENRAPAAPVMEKPPFSFSAQSPPPDGVPLAYGPNQLTRAQLSIPPAKKRKIQNKGGSSVTPPTQMHGAPAATTSPRASKTLSPRIQRSHAPVGTIQCPEPLCDSGPKGFTSPEDLNKHIKEKHQVVEPPIADPLEWALEGIRISLGIGEDGASKGRSQEKEGGKPVHAAPSMKQSASMQGLTPMKMEGGTPMSRIPTQTGYQSNLSLPRTPQQSVSSVKTPASDTKQPLSKTGLGELRRAGSTAKDSLTSADDNWIDTSISPSELSVCFPTVADLQGCLSLASLTPASTLSTSKSENNSPKESDIGEGDGLRIQIEMDSWLPTGFLDDTLGPEIGSQLVDDDILGMEWDSAFGSSVAENEKSLGKRHESSSGNTSFDISLFSFEG